MNLLNKEQMEVKKVLIAKHVNEIITAVNDLSTWGAEDYKPFLEDILFAWLQNIDSELEYRNDVIFKFRRLMDFTETLAKIDSSDNQGSLINQMDERVN